MSDAASLEAPFRGQVVVLQGASGAVGGRLAERLFSAGARLALPVRRGWQVDRLATRLAELAPDRGADRLIAEVGSTDSQAAAGFAKGTVDSLGPPSACISCSGAFAFAPIGEDSANTLYELFEANVSAPYTLLRAFVPGMKRRKSGRIVLVGAAAAAPGSDPTPASAPIVRPRPRSTNSRARSPSSPPSPFTSSLRRSSTHRPTARRCPMPIARIGSRSTRCATRCCAPQPASSARSRSSGTTTPESGWDRRSRSCSPSERCWPSR
jgi:hypothetical protein